MLNNLIDNLGRYIAEQPPLAIAVSGGVDSLTLAWIANQAQPETSLMVHAVSPAVPPEATALVKEQANQANWRLQILDAHEYNDPLYRKNPVNRCYYCKTNLYSRIKSVTGLAIASGTNTDDLGDFRPGLTAAAEHGVVHPYVEVGVNKASIRQIASSIGLHEIAELPAQPCLASRVETGIHIDANDLVFINNMEKMLRAKLGKGDIRCRLTAKGVKLEIDSSLFSTVAEQRRTQKTGIEQLAKQLCNKSKKVYLGIAPYERGSAFLHSHMPPVRVL